MGYKRAVLAVAFAVSSPAGLLAQGVWTVDNSTGSNLTESVSASALNGKIFVFADSGGRLLRIFDPVTHIWSNPAQSGIFVGQHTYTSSVIAGKIYYIGSSRVGGLQSTLEIYDPNLNSCAVVKSTGNFTPREYMTASVVDNKIYVYGGDTGSNIRTNILEVFDPSSKTWSTPITTGHTTARLGHTASVVNGKIYVIGGDTGGYYGCNILEVFDPSTNTWSTPKTTGQFTERRYLTSSVLNGKIYVMGGDSGGNIRPLSTLEIFDPTSNTWSSPVTNGQMRPRFFLTSVTENGSIYVMGGYRPHGGVSDNDVFTPSADGIEFKRNSDEIGIFPNPISDIVTILGSNIERIGITNALGISVQTPPGSGRVQEGEITLDLSHLPAGTYFARIETADGTLMRKIVKE